MNNLYMKNQEKIQRMSQSKKKVSIQKGTLYGNWKLVKRLGKGGNGEVWFSKFNKKTCAVKILSKVSEKAYSRFRDEIQVINGIKNYIGSKQGKQLDFLFFSRRQNELRLEFSCSFFPHFINIITNFEIQLTG